MDAKARADKFDGLYVALKAAMEDQEQVLANQDSIHSNVESVKQQLEEHKVSG